MNEFWNSDLAGWNLPPPHMLLFATIVGFFFQLLFQRLKKWGITCWTVVIGSSSYRNTLKRQVHLTCSIKGEGIHREVVAVGGIRCSEVCIAGSVIFCSQVQHIKKSEQSAIKKNNTPVPGDTAGCCSARERKFYVTVHPLQHVVLTWNPSHWINHSINCHNLFASFGSALSVTVSWDPMSCLPNHSITSHKTTTWYEYWELSTLSYGLYVSTFLTASRVPCPHPQ
jgi:hypothetical protein